MPAGVVRAGDPYMLKFDRVNKSTMYTHQHCYTHGQDCPLFDASARADLEVAGLPCPDMSRQGLGRKEEGPTVGAFLSHAKRHVEKQTKLIIVENTKARPIQS